MKKTLIASAVAAASFGVCVNFERYDLDDQNFILRDPVQGKRGIQRRRGKCTQHYAMPRV